MKGYCKITISLLLTLSLFTICSACGKTSNPTDIEANSTLATNSGTRSEWTEQVLCTDGSLYPIGTMTMDSERILFTAMDGSIGYSRIYEYNFSTKLMTQADDIESNAADGMLHYNIETVSVIDGMTYYASERIQQKEDGDYERLGLFLVIMNQRGTEEKEYNIESLIEDGPGSFGEINCAESSISAIAVSDSAIVLLIDNMEHAYLVFLDNRDEIHYIETPSDTVIGGLYVWENEIYAVDPLEGTVYEIDLENEKLVQSGTVCLLYDGYEGTVPLYTVVDGELTALCQNTIEVIQLESGKSETMADLLNSGIKIESPAGFLGNQEQYFVLDSDENGALQVRAISKSDRSAQRQEITIGTLFLNTALQDAVIAFNQQQEQYHISIRNYGNEYSEGGISAGATALAMDIINGNAPDLIDTTYIPTGLLNTIKDSGLLADLTPMFEQDSNISLDDYFSNIIEMSKENDGSLYEFVTEFTILTMAAHSTDRTALGSMTWPEIYAAFRENDAVAPVSGGRSNLIGSIMLNPTAYIDYTNKTCSFDTEEFLDFLAFISEDYPAVEDDDNTAFRNGEDMLCYIELDGFGAITPTLETLGNVGDYCFLGYPGESDGLSIIIPENMIAISASSDYQDAAWTFLTYILDNGTYAETFPADKNKFMQILNQAQVEGNEMTGYASTGEFLIEVISETSAEQLIDLVENADFIYRENSDILDIIQEEIVAYLENGQTAEMTSANIQSRVQILLSEQYN